MINRQLQVKLEKKLFQQKVVILYGARQVGKTTLVKNLLSSFGKDSKYLSCDQISVQKGLESKDIEQIKIFLGNYKLIALDEAQNVNEVGKILKLIVDFFPEVQIIATGSSSFDLADKVSEPLTGRNFTFLLYPLSVSEIVQNSDQARTKAELESFLRFGMYPEVYTLQSEEEKIERLNEIASDYLYKDVLKFERIRKSDIVKRLIELLALQLGQEVSSTELATQLGINRITVEKYLDILEKSFIIFKLRSFSRNKRKEISKSFKVYFFDLGIRNSIIQNFNAPDLRTDTGALWENFCILERRKYLEQKGESKLAYFWRTYDQKELDYVEESAGKITGYEFKWNAKKTFKEPEEFKKRYGAEIEKIDPENFWSFIGIK
ncbi:MAG TPA: ATP-binding protein [Candidatus Moranbacteria bacterium]|nr:ATP-binding protein [Candidatus Moranbacteria bacterium]HSA08600.1 ATP-binding protein [Candidatus Moranbacteria bacterium]